jgi:hypothetical protein
MKKAVLFFLFVFLSVNSFGQQMMPDRLSLLFEKQLKVFPQEKIYLHTDKPYYISGEQIWFRAYLVDAAVHVPVFASRYIYVELINPLDTVVTRVKVLQTDSVYCGHIEIPPESPEGDYTLRAYTHFMRSVDEHYWYSKNIHIGDPQACDIHTDAQFYFASDQKITAEFRFMHPSLSSAVIPENVKVCINGGKQKNIKTDGNVAGVSFDLPPDARKRVIFLEIENAKRLYRQFISIPVPDDDFDVTFYPEGGVLPEDTLVKVAFKAMKSNGQSSTITGVIYDNDAKEITPIKSDYSGMGVFGIRSEKGKTYYAVCTNEKGKSKRFGLPAAYKDRHALHVTQGKDNLYISVLKPAAMTQQDTLYLLAHTRGVVYYADRWPNEKKTVIAPSDLFPSGVLHLLLLNARLQPLSERLVFIRNDDQAKVDFHTDKDNYAERSPVRAEVMLTGTDQEPLSGNFSVSVTDDREVITDTCNNMPASLLLTSDLRGYIESPASYFSNSAGASNKLDLLMLTQGWRRYDVPALTGGTLSRPAAALEAGAEISGTVKNMLTGKAAADIEVTLFSTNQKYFDKTKTDQKGKFYFVNCDLPDSTQFIVHAEPKRGLRRMEITIDQESYPEKTLPAVTQEAIDRNVFAQYTDKAEQKYTYENGIRMINLKEVTITAKPKSRYKSIYYDEPDHSFTEEDLEKLHLNTTEDIYNVLRRVPGIRIINNGKIVEIQIRGQRSLLLNNSPIVLMDGFPVSIDDIPVQTIGQIDILKNASMFGMRGANGAIIFHSKEGKVPPRREQPHVKFVTPLGYQKPVEFYSPKYDTPKARENSAPDLRTTIYWQPVVQVDHKGKAFFDFYTADSETTYTVILEGITSEGKIIHKEQKIMGNAQ